MSAPNRAQLAGLGLFWDSVAEDAKTRSRAAREELNAAAQQELERDGIAPTWRVPGFGTVPLTLTAPSIEVTDPDAYLTWVAERHPDEIETVRRVRPSFDERIRRSALKRGDPPSTPDGEAIPGLKFRPGGQPRGVQLRPDAQAKEQAALTAHAFLDSLIQPNGGDQS